MKQKLYAILITDCLHNERFVLHKRVFATKEDAYDEIEHLATSYIKKREKRNRKEIFRFNKLTSTVTGGPNGACLFAEIIYKIQEIKLG